MHSMGTRTSLGNEDDDQDLDAFLADMPELEDSDRPARQKKAKRRVSFALSKPCRCSLCNSTSTDESPLLSSTSSDAWGGKRPWGKYRKDVKDKNGEEWSVPEGRLCLLCKCVFKLLGLAYEHGGFKKYAEKVKSKQVDHTTFLAALSEWIKTHNQDPSKSRMEKAQKDAVKTAKQTLTSQKEGGVQFEAPDTFFVAVEHWDEKAYGPLDESKVEEKKLFGKLIKGAYVQTGKAGHFKVRDFEKNSHVHSTLEHDGEQDIFNEASLATKKGAISAAFEEAEAERRKSAALAKPSQTSVMDMDSILTLIGQAQATGSGEQPGNAGAEAASGQGAVKAEVADAESSSDSDPAPVAERLGVKKAKAKAKSKPTSAPPSAARTSTGGSPLYIKANSLLMVMSLFTIIMFFMLQGFA